MPRQVSPRSSPRQTPHSQQAQRIARAIAHAETHLDQALDAHTLADVAAMSRHHFQRLFMAHVGCTVSGFVTWRRLQRACALLVSGHESVLEVALAVGYESGQALAKAMRRELNITPTAVRRGQTGAWSSLLIPGRLPTWPFDLADQPREDSPMTPTRFATTPALQALTATARGMVDHNMTRAAQQAFEELMRAVGRAGLMPQVASCIGLMPEDAKGPDDPHCRFVAGVLFGYRLADGSGSSQQPDLALTGTLAWWPLAAGRHAVFSHQGPYTGLHQTWHQIYRDWLPSSGQTLRDVAPFELSLNDPKTTAPEALLTEIWLPLV